MSVVLNEVGLHALLDTRSGAVGRDLERRSVLALEAMRDVMTDIIRAIPREQIQLSISDDPLRSEIGLAVGPSGSTKWSDYFVAKNIREPGRISNAVLLAAGFQT